MPEKTLASVMELLAGILLVKDEEITPDMALTKDNGVEALDVAQLVIACEKKFRITVHDEDVHRFLCSADVARYIDALLETGDETLALRRDGQRDAWYYE